jgi:glycosyltransferase involved in cell wall biosynthesis
MQTKDQPTFSIVLPFYNEESCAEQVLCELDTTCSALRFPVEIIAVQNGSLDSTGEILHRLARLSANMHVIDVRENKGFGHGVKRGLAECTGQVVGYMPGDGQVDPQVLPLLLQRMVDRHADVAKGRRVIRHDGRLRWFVSRNYELFAGMLIGLRTSDINGHPKLMTRAAYSALALQSDDHFIDAEILIKAQRLGLRLCELEVEFRPRLGGSSKVRLLKFCAEGMAHLLRARFSRRKPWDLAG